MTTPSTALRIINSPFSTLRKLIAESARAQPCDLCGVGLSAAHQHLIQYEQRRLACACDRCCLLLSSQADTRYRRVIQTIRYLQDFRQTDAEWESLGVPIGLAFFFHRTPLGKVVALYPSPAGPTEATPDLNCWRELAGRNPVLKEMKPDVEGLLVNRIGAARDYYWVSIDICLTLTGLIRKHWRGLSGGRALWEEVDKYFVDLKKRGRAYIKNPHA